MSGKDAVTFLSGVPPTNFYRNQIQRYVLLEVLYNLTGENDPTGNFTNLCQNVAPITEMYTHQCLRWQ